MILLNTVLLAFILTTIAGLTTLLGTLIIFIFKKQSNLVVCTSLAFAAGVMICVSLIDLIPESINLLKTTFNSFGTILLLLIFIMIGIFISCLIDRFFPSEQVGKKNGKLYRIGIISMIAIIMHNVPEGIATFLATDSKVSLGLSLAIAISLHNIPEGISISVPIYYATGNKKKAFLYTLISGLSEPFGSLLAYLFLRSIINDTIMGCLFAIIAGIMIHISIYELLPTSLKYKNKKICLLFFIIGLIFMYFSHMLFSI